MAHDLDSLTTRYLAQISDDALAASTDPAKGHGVEGYLVALSNHIARIEAHMTLLLDQLPGVREAISTPAEDDTA